ncbi:MAG TPA: MFS transporter, partial [Bryobacteraceae bacterium]|nr:MFS transporter [Bryobacteraceae bacterium]
MSVASSTVTPTVAPPQVKAAAGTAFSILAAISFCHLLNDMLQSVIPAVYPLLKSSYHLDFSQIGLITLTVQLTASLLQPLVGLYNDRRARPYSLPIGMGFTLIGLVLLSRAPSYAMVLVSVALIGVGSSVFHPESSRVARMASGGQHGLAQSLFQVGGNAGTSLGPLLAAFIVLPFGQRSIGWFAAAALTAIIVLTRVAAWHQRRRTEKQVQTKRAETTLQLSSKRVTVALGILVALVFSKFFYMVSLNSFYIFYLINKFHLDVRTAQIYLFIFLGSV